MDHNNNNNNTTIIDGYQANLTQTTDELLYEKNAEHLKHLIPVIAFFGCEVIFGIFGNILTLYVFFFRYKACNFRYFVMSLAVVDLISCFTTIPGEMVTQIFWFNYPVPHVCKGKDYFNQFTACAEAALLTVIAIDRHRKVCEPLRWQIKQRGAMFACIGIFVVSALLAIPTPIFWGVRSRPETYENRSINVTICEKDQKYIHTEDALGTTAFNGCLVLISLIIMLVLYILILKQLVLKHRELKRRKSLRPKEETNETSIEMGSSDQSTGNECRKPAHENTSEDSNTHTDKRPKSASHRGKKNKEDGAILDRARRKTMIGFYLAVTFIFTTIIFWLMISLVAAGVLQKLNDSGKAAYTFFLRLYFINHVINPILYGLMDPHFQAEMRRMKALVSKGCTFISRYQVK